MSMHNPPPDHPQTPPDAPLGSTPAKPPVPMTPRERDQLKPYGLTEATYNALVVARGNRCAACGRTPQQARSSPTVRAIRLMPDLLRPANLLCRGCKRALNQYRKDWITYNAEALWSHVQAKSMHHIICYMASDPGRSDVWGWMKRNRYWIQPPPNPTITPPAIPDEPPPPLPSDKHPTGQYRAPGALPMDPAKALPARSKPVLKPRNPRLGPSYRGRGRPKQSDYIDADEPAITIPDPATPDEPVIGSIFGDIFGDIGDIPPPDDSPNPPRP